MNNHNTGQPIPMQAWDRRNFISSMTKVTGAAVLLTSSIAGLAVELSSPGPWTVGRVMDLFIREVPGTPFENTVDTLKSGSRDQEVTGIVTTMFATLQVIRKAIEVKANFIIAHEPTFYNHLDGTDWLQNDDVYQYKAALLKDHNIAVWRNHDHIHRLKEDGVLKGLVNQLGWSGSTAPDNAHLFTRPSITLKDLVGEVKQRLGISMVRYIGDLTQPISRILLMPGAAGGKAQIEAISQTRPDALFCGEISEWETAEYVRDATAKGQKLSLVVMGHIASEEAGSTFMKKWLQEKVTGIPVTHVPAGNSLSFI